MEIYGISWPPLSPRGKENGEKCHKKHGFMAFYGISMASLGLQEPHLAIKRCIY